MNATFEHRQQKLFQTFVQRHGPKQDKRLSLLPWAGPGDEGSFDLRTSVYLATALAEVGQFDAAWRILPSVFVYQDLEPSSFTRGNYFWRTAWRDSPGYVRDPNAASFIVPHLALLLHRHRNRMPAATAQAIERSLALAGDALLAHRATWGYTNIALLNIAAKMLIGSVLDDPRMRRLGCWDWEEWRNHTGKQGGINETFSNTYTGVQIEALAMMLDGEHVPEGMRREVRQVLRHLLTASLIDLHPRVGRITGPQSRAYPYDRHHRRHSLMDTILYLLFGEQYIAPDGPAASYLWVGAPICEADLLIAPGDLPLPRTTEARTHGYHRVNYLADDFALGSVTCHNRLFGITTPALLAYRSGNDTCVLSLLADARPHGYHAAQRDHHLLTAVTWLDGRALGTLEQPDIGHLSGLKTGRPEAVCTEPEFAPGLSFELGAPDPFELVDHAGKPVRLSRDAVFEEPICALRLGAVFVHIAFFSAPDAPLPTLTCQLGEGDVWCLRAAVPLPAPTGKDTGVEPVMLGCCMYVEPAAPAAGLAEWSRARRPRLHITGACGQWRVTDSRPAPDGPLDLQIQICDPLFYAVDGRQTSATDWCLAQLGQPRRPASIAAPLLAAPSTASQKENP